MLVIIPSGLSGRLGAVLSALIVVCCLIGLTMHKDFYAGKPRRDFFFYYTNLSNLLVLLYFALCAPLLYAKPALHFLIPHTEYIVMLSILLTTCVFHLLLFPAVRRAAQRMQPTRAFQIMRADNLFVHYLVPWLVFFYWLLCAPGKEKLRWWDAPLFMLFPLVYLLMVFLRAPLRGNLSGEDSPYPYPFLDIKAHGVFRVVRTCALLFAVCIACALLGVFLVNVFVFLFGTGHLLILI